MATATTKQFNAIDPATEKVFQKIPDASIEEVHSVIAHARRSFDGGPWKDLSYAERGIYLKKIAQLIRDHAQELVQLEITDVGKTLKHAQFIDIPTSADCFDYYSEVAIEDRENKVSAPVRSLTLYEPRGVVAAICAYNYPMIYAAWKIAPAIITGNVVILKPSPYGSASVYRLGELIKKVGIPEGVINVVTTTSNETAMELVRSLDVDMVSFTGGTETGRKIMTEAAKSTKKIILELGGKSPNIVFDDCQLDSALGGTLAASFLNQGQMCTAGSRLFVHEKIYDEFVVQLVKRASAIEIGNPNEAVTEFGPLTSKEQRDAIIVCIEQAKQEGATVACGGSIPKAPGFYFEPTILTNVSNNMKIAQEECFGPVLCVLKFKTEEEVIQLANDSKYGLAACVWTQDIDRAKRVARALNAGTVWINTYGAFLNEASYGGYKQSGIGRELGVDGLREYMQVKHMCIDETPGGMPLVAAWF